MLRRYNVYQLSVVLKSAQLRVSVMKNCIWILWCMKSYAIKYYMVSVDLQWNKYTNTQSISQYVWHLIMDTYHKISSLCHFKSSMENHSFNTSNDTWCTITHESNSTYKLNVPPPYYLHLHQINTLLCSDLNSLQNKIQ